MAARNNKNAALNANSAAAADEHLAFWNALPDAEFFGPRVQHLYFYNDRVDDESVLLLRDQVLEACRSVQNEHGTWVDPLPIVVHVHSPGGSMGSMQWLLSLFNQVHVPICAMVDGISASAATALSVMAPFRVATPYSMSLLHDYAVRGMSGKREQLLEDVRSTEARWSMMRELYLARTRIPEPQLDALLRRDMWLDAPTCLRYGIYDRVIRPDRAAEVRAYAASTAMPRLLPIATGAFFKTNWNRVFATCDSYEPYAFDLLLHEASRARPVLYVTPGGNSYGDCDRLLPLSMIARIQSSPVPVIAVVDNAVDWWQMLPVLFCHKRFMYENATLDSGMVYERTWGMRLQDIVHNAKVMRDLIRGVVKARATPTPELLKDMFDRTMTLSAADCLANGLVDAVVPLSARRGSRTPAAATLPPPQSNKKDPRPKKKL